MTRQITVYEKYDNPSLRRKIWEKLRDDFYGVFKAEYPTSGRAAYKDTILTSLSRFGGAFYLDGGQLYDPFIDDVRGKTIENFLGKRDDQDLRSNPMDKTLRFFHAYLLVKYPQIQQSLRCNDYAQDYIQMLDAKYLNWKHSDQATFNTIRTLSGKLCGIYTSHHLEQWPHMQEGVEAPEFTAAQASFGGTYRMVILSMLKSEPILLVHYLSFQEQDIPKLQRGFIDSMNIGRASGAAVPSTIGLNGDQHLVRFDLLMSNRKQNDLPFYFPITIDRNGNNAESFKSFTAGRFDYAPQLQFVRTSNYKAAGLKLFDLYGVDI